jgi:hypothetical protein
MLSKKLEFLRSFMHIQIGALRLLAEQNIYALTES